VSEEQEARDERELSGTGTSQLRQRAAAAVQRSRALQAQCDHLMESAHRIAAEWHMLRSASTTLLKNDVTDLARTLRANGETPERALILLKSAIEPALVELPDEREVILGDVVRWFVESYFAA
jgi:hypothetical protein